MIGILRQNRRKDHRSSPGAWANTSSNSLHYSRIPIEQLFGRHEIAEQGDGGVIYCCRWLR